MGVKVERPLRPNDLDAREDRCILDNPIRQAWDAAETRHAGTVLIFGPAGLSRRRGCGQARPQAELGGGWGVAVPKRWLSTTSSADYRSLPTGELQVYKRCGVTVSAQIT